MSSSRLKPPFKKVTVEWTDAWTHSGWEDSAEAKRNAGAPCVTTGYLLHSDKDGVTVASTVGPHATGTWQSNARMFIPRQWIKKIA